MSTTQTAMARETREAPHAVARLLAREGDAIRALGRRLAGMDPPVVVTCARGSSDHAAHYLKYLLETSLGLPVASVGPSVASVFGTKLRMKGAVVVTVSQSGRAPDVLAFQEAAKAGGALSVALVNDTTGPIAAGADVVIPLNAGPETSVAATKSFVASVAAGAAITAAWTGDAAMAAAVEGLPERLRLALGCDWSAAAPMFAAPSGYMLGRGPALAIAHEAALKAKEVVARHAEAFSLAEVMHGPLQLVQPGFPVLAFLPGDAARGVNAGALERLAGVGAEVFAACPDGAGLPGTPLPAVACGHAALDPLGMILSFYGLVEQVARGMGLDPDRPSHLQKVTKTI